MIADDDLRLLVHLYDEEGQNLVTLIFAPTQENPPELIPVDGIVSLLEVDEGCKVSPLLALTRVDLG